MKEIVKSKQLPDLDTKISINIYMTQDLKNKLKNAANKKNMSMSTLIKEYIEYCLKEEGWME